MQNRRLALFIEEFLNENIPTHYYYHNLAHTMYVREKALEIGAHEGCSADELRLLEAAALFHDAGYVFIRNGHEAISCELASEHLPGFGFNTVDIGKICGMIMATKLPQTPHSKCEEILADADLEYLGTDRVGDISQKFLRELQAINPAFTQQQWDVLHVNFLNQHKYFTSYCKTNKQPVKEAYLTNYLATLKR